MASGATLQNFSLDQDQLGILCKPLLTGSVIMVEENPAFIMKRELETIFWIVSTEKSPDIETHPDFNIQGVSAGYPITPSHRDTGIHTHYSSGDIL